MKTNLLNSKSKIIILQLIGWSVILSTSLILGSNSDLFGVMIFLLSILKLLLIYIINYIFFIPKFLFKDNRSNFFILNFILIIVLLISSYYINEFEVIYNLFPASYVPQRPKPNLIYLTHDLITYVLMIGLVTALRLAERLQKSEEALREAESARVRAELANLRSQINPHFLLNTLNNIYALTTIDTEKAQKTIKELSNLLRYVLYENFGDKVLLVKEIDFIKTYIELMSIRLPHKVRVTTEFKLPQECSTYIAPLLFISLIENAFKHSVNASGEGFIDILFEDKIEENEVVLQIRNSNNAKKEDDKSGHGIGLEQVKRRLELLYSKKYQWTVSETKNEYISCLILKKS